MDFAGEFFSAPTPCETPGSINTQVPTVKHKTATAVSVNFVPLISGIPPRIFTALTNELVIIDHISRDWFLKHVPPVLTEFLREWIQTTFPGKGAAMEI